MKRNYANVDLIEALFVLGADVFIWAILTVYSICSLCYMSTAKVVRSSDSHVPRWNIYDLRTYILCKTFFFYKA